MIKNIKRIGLISLGLLPTVVFGQNKENLGDSPIRNIDDIIRIMNKGINYFFTGLMILATVFVLYAGFLYLTASGNEEKVKQAKTTLLYAAIGVAIAVSARGLVSMVRSFIE